MTDSLGAWVVLNQLRNSCYYSYGGVVFENLVEPMKNIIASIVCFVYLALVAGNTFGPVLCIHADGGVELELANSRCCDSTAQGETAYLEEDCCIDVSLEAKQQEIASPKSTIKVDHQVNSVPVDLHFCQVPGVPVGSHPNFLFATSHSSPNSTLSALRSVILLI